MATQLLERGSKFGTSGHLASINVGASYKVRGLRAYRICQILSESVIADVLNQWASDQWMIQEERTNFLYFLFSWNRGG